MRGCLGDIVVALVLFVLVGVVAGDVHTANHSFSIMLTTGPTLVFVALILVYVFRYRRR